MTTLRNEIRILFSTIMFFTLVPVPTLRFSPQHLQKIMRYVSLVGLAIGCVGAAAYWFCAQFVDGTAAPAIADITEGVNNDPQRLLRSPPLLMLMT